MTRRGLWMAVLLVAGTGVAAADDMDTSYQNLQDAVAKKDVAAVKKLAAETSALARQEIAKPGEDADSETGKQRLEYVRSVDTYTEYALYATAVQSEAPVLVDLIAALEAQNPKSKYLDQAYGPYMAALAKTGATAKVPEIAEKAVANFPQNPDLLLLLADNAASRGQADRELNFSTRLVALWSSRPKAPEGVAAADWDRKREVSLGHAYYMAGMVYAQRTRWVDADQNLRAALPYAKGNPPMLAQALFQLGIANYNLGKMTMNKAKVLEGAKFSEQCAAIQSAVAQQAYKNSLVMKTEADRMR